MMIFSVSKKERKMTGNFLTMRVSW